MRRVLSLLLLALLIVPVPAQVLAAPLAAPTACSTAGATLVLWNSYPADGAYSFIPPDSNCLAFVPQTGGVAYSISTVEGSFTYTGSVAVLRTGVVGLITTSVAVDVFQVLTSTPTIAPTATPPAGAGTYPPFLYDHSVFANNVGGYVDADVFEVPQGVDTILVDCAYADHGTDGHLNIFENDGVTSRYGQYMPCHTGGGGNNIYFEVAVRAGDIVHINSQTNPGAIGTTWSVYFYYHYQVECLIPSDGSYHVCANPSSLRIPGGSFPLQYETWPIVFLSGVTSIRYSVTGGDWDLFGFCAADVDSVRSLPGSNGNGINGGSIGGVSRLYRNGDSSITDAVVDVSACPSHSILFRFEMGGSTAFSADIAPFKFEGLSTGPTATPTGSPTATRTPTPATTPTIALPGIPAGCAVVNLSFGGSSQPLTVLPGTYSVRASWQFANPVAPPFFTLSSGQASYSISNTNHRFVSNMTFYGTGAAYLNWRVTSGYESLLGKAVRVDVCPLGAIGTITPSASPTGTIFPIGTPTLTGSPSASPSITWTPTASPSASPTAGGGPTPVPTAPIDCLIPLTPSPTLLAPPTADLAITLPTLRTLPTSDVTATVTFSATAIIGAISTMQAGMSTPVAAMQTATSGYSWDAGAAIATSWTLTMQPALDWLAIFNTSNAAWSTPGGPLWALAPILLPLSPIIITGLIIVFVRFFLWFTDRLLKLVDLVIKLIELIPGE